MINCGIEIFKESLSTNFALIAVFVKVAFKITKRAQHCVLPRFTHFHFQIGINATRFENKNSF